MKKIILILFLALTNATAEEQQKKIAVVLMIKGEAFCKNDQGNVSKIKKNLWLYEGNIIRTKEKSFVKILFQDKSSINLGPDSQVKITQFQEQKSTLIDLLRGSMRAKVSKDYMKIKDKERSKLLVKTKTAAMGVRGTDFTTTFDQSKNVTQLQVWEGQVLFVKINEQLSTIIDQRTTDIIDTELNKNGTMVTQGHEIKEDQHKERGLEVTPIDGEKIKKYEEEVKKQNLENTIDKNKIYIPTTETSPPTTSENLTKIKEKVEFRPLSNPEKEDDKNALVEYSNDHKVIPPEIHHEIQKQQQELKEVYETHRQMTELHQKEMIKEHIQQQQIIIEREKEPAAALPPPPPPPTSGHPNYP